MLKACELIAAELVGPGVLLCGQVSEEQVHSSGANPLYGKLEEVGYWDGHAKELVKAGLAGVVVRSRRHAEALVAVPQAAVSAPTPEAAGGAAGLSGAST